MGHKHSKGKISHEDLQYLLSHTTHSKEEIKEWHKGFLEDCPNGELTKEQFVDMYVKIFPGGNAEKFSENVFRTFDTDKSGTIDFREFMLALHVTSSGTPEEKLAWAFKMYDVDGNGGIDFDEMKRTIFAVYEMVGTPADMTKAEELFLKLDQNSDGYISQEEFISIIKRDHNLLNILQKTT